MRSDPAVGGRRGRAKEDKRRRIVSAARALFAAHGVGGVTTQQIADRADIAIGTLYLYAATKAELLIMVQNHTFAAAIEVGIDAVAALDGHDAATLNRMMALLTPVVSCIRAHPENGRTYLHELVFGDPAEPHRGVGLTLAARVETELTRILAGDPRIDPADARTLARVTTAIVHVAATATTNIDDALPVVLGDIRRQVGTVLPCSPPTRREETAAQGR